MPDHVIADAILAGFLVLATLYGLRRGFFKEVIALLALVGATYIAIRATPLVGPIVAEKLRLPADAAMAFGAVGVWLAGYFACVFAGRLAFKFLKRSPTERLEDAAGKAAGAVAGNTSARAPGPVTRILKPLPTKAGLVYWTDKVLGAALGLAKGALAVVIFLFVATQQDMGRVGAAARASHAMRAFQGHVRPRIEALPETKVVLAMGKMRRIAVAVKADPSRFERVAKHPSLERLREYPPLREAAEDPDLRTAIEKRAWSEALRNPRLIALLKDREFVRRLAEVDYQQVLEDVEAPEVPHFLDEKPHAPGAERMPPAGTPAPPEPGAPPPAPGGTRTF